MSAKEAEDGKPRSVLVKDSDDESDRSTDSAESSQRKLEDHYTATAGVIDKERALMLNKSCSQPQLLPLQDSGGAFDTNLASSLKERSRKGRARAASSSKEGLSSDAEESQDMQDSKSDIGNETKEDVNAKREYNRLCAAKSRAKRKKVLSGLNEQVENEVRKYYALCDQNKAQREKVGLMLDDTLSDILGDATQRVFGSNISDAGKS